MFTFLPEYTQKLRIELRHERVYSQTLKRAHLAQKQKSEKLEEENTRLKKENETLKKENGKLKDEIEKLTKTNNRYQISLFDHGNFSHPDKKDRKKKGGQIGHTNTNKDKKRDYSSFNRQRIHADTCGKCGNTLARTESIKEKILIDIQINPQLIETICQVPNFLDSYSQYF